VHICKEIPHLVLFLARQPPDGAVLLEQANGLRLMPGSPTCRQVSAHLVVAELELLTVQYAEYLLTFADQRTEQFFIQVFARLKLSFAVTPHGPCGLAQILFGKLRASWHADRI